MNMREFVRTHIIPAHPTDSLTTSDVYQAWRSTPDGQSISVRPTTVALQLMRHIREVHGARRDPSNVVWGWTVRPAEARSTLTSGPGGQGSKA